MTKKSKKLHTFPIITKGNFHTQSGNIYINHGEYWYQNVNFLAAVPKQYGCDSYEQQFDRIIRKIEDGSLRPEATGEAFIMQDEQLQAVRNKTAHRANRVAES